VLVSIRGLNPRLFDLATPWPTKKSSSLFLTLSKPKRLAPQVETASRSTNVRGQRPAHSAVWGRKPACPVSPVISVAFSRSVVLADRPLPDSESQSGYHRYLRANAESLDDVVKTFATNLRQGFVVDCWRLPFVALQLIMCWLDDDESRHQLLCLNATRIWIEEWPNRRRFGLINVTRRRTS
jgi:hypothetical protein